MQPDMTYTFDGKLTLQDKATSDYYYLSFDVPENITRLDISYDYTRTGHMAQKAGYENIIDIGLFDAGGYDFNGTGFRGWSGGNRAQFFVGLTEATPGYLPGPISAGAWYVILGLYKIAPEGCNYKVTVRLTQSSQPHQPGGVPVMTPAQFSEVVRPGAGWYCGDLQTHTHHSDAQASVSEIVAVARTRGLDFLAITDHNTVSQLSEVAMRTGPDLLLIPSMEVTSYYGHANVWGLSRWIDFRCRKAEEIRQVIEAAHNQKALFSINHPHSTCSWEYGWIDGVNAIEVWNGLWDESNYRSLIWWDELLQSGRQIVAVGGSDRHQPREFDPYFPHQVGTPTTWVYAENLSVAAILAGIRAGHAFITADVDGPRIRLAAKAANGQTAMMGDTLALTPGTPVTFECEVEGAKGQVLELIQDGRIIERRVLEDETFRTSWTGPVESNGYLRGQLAAAGSGSHLSSDVYPRILALTNPIYLLKK
jgi:hypothetical protein